MATEINEKGMEVHIRRACLRPLASEKPSVGNSKYLPVVSFDPKSQTELPCDDVLKDEQTLSVLPMARVPVKGCFNQRKEGLCPLEYSLDPEEIKL